MALVRKGLHIRLGKKAYLQISFSRVMLYLFIILLVCFTSLPLIYVITTAFKPIDELLKFPPQFFFKKPTLSNFKDLILAANSASVPFLRSVANSLVVVVIAVFSSVFVSSIGAYSVAKMDLPFKKHIMSMVVAALAFPEISAIPTYLIIKELNMLNTYWALILPRLGSAFNFFMMRQFCSQIPNPLLEAARIDGANELRIFISIVFPFLAPAWATLIVFCFTAVWNDSTGPVYYITNEAMRTLPVAINAIGGSLARSGAMAAATLIMTAPTVIIYTALQSRVIETMAHSGIK